MTLIKFLELIHLRGNIEFLGSCLIEFTGEKIKVNFLYKKILKLIGYFDFKTSFTGKFGCTDIKEFIKNLKSMKDEFEIKLDKTDLLCYNSNQEIRISGITEDLVLNKSTKITEPKYFEFDKQQIKQILEFRSCMDCKEIHVFSGENEIIFEAEDGEISREEKIKIYNINNFDLFLGNEFLDMLSVIKNNCFLYFENDKVFIKFCGENFEVQYCLKGLEK